MEILDFYSVHFSLDVKKVYGNSEQIKRVIPHCHVDNPLFIDNWNPNTGEQPIVWDFELKDKSKLTDLIFYPGVGASKGLIISNDLYNELLNFDLSDILFFDLNVFHKSIPYRYKYVRSLKDHLEFIDFKKSEISVRENGLYYTEDIVITSLDSYYDTSRKLEKGYKGSAKFHNLAFEKVKIIKGIATDFFSLSNVYGSKFYVSQKIVDMINYKGFTGISFAPSELDFEEGIEYRKSKA